MKIGLISDTHDNFKTIESAVKIFREKRIDYVIYAGDITTPEAVVFAGLKIDRRMGNNDVDKKGLENAFGKNRR